MDWGGQKKKGAKRQESNTEKCQQKEAGKEEPNQHAAIQVGVEPFSVGLLATDEELGRPFPWELSDVQAEKESNR